LCYFVCRTPQEAKSKPKKNVSRDKLGTTMGRIHMGKQNVTAIQTRKMKGLKKTAAEKRSEKKKGGVAKGKVTKRVVKGKKAPRKSRS